jgi:hypothetical protein
MSPVKTVQSILNFTLCAHAQKKRSLMYTLFYCKGLITGKDSGFTPVKRIVFLHLHLGAEGQIAGIAQTGNDVSFGG